MIIVDSSNSHSFKVGSGLRFRFNNYCDDFVPPVLE